MGNKERTPNSQIKHALRLLWMKSRERSTALKREGYCCQKCGKKKSVKKGAEQKIEVHHKEGIGNWDKVIALIQEEILCEPEKLEVLCPECHGLQP